MPASNGKPRLSSWPVPDDELSQLLARSLAHDLRGAGLKASVQRRDGTSRLVVRLGAPDDSLIRARQRQRAEELLEEAESSAKALLPSDARVLAHLISPVIRICEEPEELRLFEYCRMSQGVPSGRRIGRQIRALVYDAGQVSSPLLIGAIGLASPIYGLACRDQFLEWAGPAARSTKELGLRRMMDLHLCVALPPYSSLLGGKLLAGLAVSDTFANEFRRKYKDHLLAICSSCATGIHCPIFNRINLRPGGLYRRVGSTAGYTLAWMSPLTLQLARKVADPEGITPHSILGFKAKPLVVVRRALKTLGIPFEPLLRLGRKRGIYLAPVTADGWELLRRGRPRIGPDDPLPTATVIDHWRESILTTRMERALAEEEGGTHVGSKR